MSAVAFDCWDTNSIWQLHQSGNYFFFSLFFLACLHELVFTVIELLRSEKTSKIISHRVKFLLNTSLLTEVAHQLYFELVT